MGLQGAILFVKDLPLMATFYEETVGLIPDETSRTEGWLEFNTGFALHAIPAHIAREIAIATPPDVRENTPIKLRFAVRDLEDCCRRIGAAGVRVEMRPWGAADCVDPEGNVFQICAERQTGRLS